RRIASHLARVVGAFGDAAHLIRVAGDEAGVSSAALLIDGGVFDVRSAADRCQKAGNRDEHPRQLDHGIAPCCVLRRLVAMYWMNPAALGLVQSTGGANVRSLPPEAGPIADAKPTKTPVPRAKVRSLGRTLP